MSDFFSDTFGVSSHDVGTGLGAAGDLFSGIGGFISGQASAAQDKWEQQIVDATTGIKAMLQKRQAYQIQSAAEAQAGASGLTEGGSVQAILRMNAQNLSLDNAMIRQAGAEQSGLLGMEARAAEAQGTGDLIGGILGGIGKLATGGIL